MLLRFTLVIFLSVAFVGCSQLKKSQSQPPPPTPESSPAAANYPSLAAQAKEIKEAFLRKDYAAYTDLTYSKSVEASGGKTEYAKKLAQDVKEAEARGLKYLSFTLDAPSQVIRNSGNLYAVLPNHMTVKDSEGTYRTYDCMIGVSTDSGRNWTFVDVGGFGKNGLSLVLGDVAFKLDLPPEKKPVKLSN
ncbi:MAG TPA: hypothetical protein VLL54_03225 [Pyrinomonadaceae bacterium]|nr:hypothetical protein [Pyrinomonadaceae bacterium]